MARPATAAVRLLTGEREPVRLATTANLETIVIDGVAWIQGLKVVDGVQTAIGDRVLVKDQADARLNGIYTASEGYWYRAADARAGRTIQKGTTVHVQEGTANANTVFAFQTDNPRIGTDDIVLSFYLSDRIIEILSDILTTALDPQFATLAAAQAFSPLIAPTYIRTAFYDSNQVAGSGGLYRKNGTTTGDLIITLHNGVTVVGYTLSDTPSASQKGAQKNNTTDDAPSVQASHNLASGGVEFPSGSYKMVPGPVSPFTFGNFPTVNVYRAVAMTADHMTFSGHEAVIHGVSRAGVVASDVQPVFSTDKNMTVGARKDITFDGVTFDSVNDADTTNSNQRFIYAVGVDGLRFLDTKAGSSGNRRGYYAHIQNSKNVQVDCHRHQKMTGGFNVRYTDTFVITNFVFEDFSEAIDLDGTNSRAVIRNGVFKSTSRVNQCVDVNDQIDASIGDFSVFSTGNIVTINYKTTTPDTFAEYVAGTIVRNFQVSKRIVVSNISGSAIGSAVAPAIYIGWDWSSGNHAGANPVQDIILQNIMLDDHGYFDIHEVVNLKIKDVTSYRALCGYNHAVHCISAAANSDQIAWSDLDVDIDGLRIEASDKGGLNISTPSRAKVRRLVTHGNNTLGGSLTDLTITSLATRAGRVSVDECDIGGNVVLNGDSTAIAAWAGDRLYKRNAIVTNGGNFYRATAEGKSASSGGPTGTALSVTDDGTASISAWAASTPYVVDDVRSNGGAYFICMTAGTSAASGGPVGADQRIADGTAIWRPINGAVRWEYLLVPYSIRWGKNNRVRGTVTIQGDAQKFIKAEKQSAHIGDLSATGAVIYPIVTADRRGAVTAVAYTVNADAPADAGNYRTLLLRRYRAGVATTIATTDTRSGLTAFVALSGGVTAANATLGFEPGDVLAITSNSAGSGMDISGLSATLSFMEF
ncbi:hypothetical protein [Mesorhizobium sp.]|uniref:hypothetical protein n=1 Tax=Mesorhizobium sp. TaxID=1871066 RepID=UPI000FE80070|nr:hypothetical protein [Mesorhizobium sp.]RWC58950.1 MAG: hypothetical protein EOS56_18770 [Mesorhizobium sp.]RWC66562.1 MAG: hypothetical protein EOS29_04125 [Mesorhizobium sp.]